MGTMVSIDEALLAQASDAAGLSEAEQVVREALRALIARENARALMAFSASDAAAWIPERRRLPLA